jgi:hypothetical protein
MERFHVKNLSNVEITVSDVEITIILNRTAALGNVTDNMDVAPKKAWRSITNNTGTTAKQSPDSS